jgi:molybdopterin-binding protein
MAAILWGRETAVRTKEAVDDLDLKVGDSVSAVIKSSDVMIGK